MGCQQLSAGSGAGSDEAAAGRLDFCKHKESLNENSVGTLHNLKILIRNRRIGTAVSSVPVCALRSMCERQRS